VHFAKNAQGPLAKYYLAAAHVLHDHVDHRVGNVHVFQVNYVRVPRSLLQPHQNVNFVLKLLHHWIELRPHLVFRYAHNPRP